ncbi:hypothetical protein FRACA_130007 [Frankia canadensis]|uniref:Uncharacterized protein n=1 Tax=Frankia canadensis TaxID=1836972 RepID=A0A2I2KKJ7_9ACTN|nr:hypothetical protein [Frankia canadensis]SNQ46183.1 hypothetical protein FRACA_130007 [Frankia canadensis]SOU53473.1 hypothetical protein FRACA_130007 [Frankia canadensis]
MPFEGTTLVVVEVEPLPPAQRPCYVTARGLYNGAFARAGDGDQRLTAYEIDRLRENAGQPRWDEEAVTQASVEDLDRRAVLRLVEAAARNSPRAFAGLNESDALTRLGVLVPHGERLVPSLAGLLAVGALALACHGRDVDEALLRRLGLDAAAARRQLHQLHELGLLRPRKARDDGTYRLAGGLPPVDLPPLVETGAGKTTATAAGLRTTVPAAGSLTDRILHTLNTSDSASREELQAATGGARSSVTKILNKLIATGQVEATAPPNSPTRRYRRRA